ncbi:MAG: hypothetical protein ABI243_04910 [Lapillicoccus sp.]
MTTTSRQTTSPVDDVTASFAAPSATPHLRQQLVILYLATSSLDSAVVGWTRYDGTGRSAPTMGDSDEPPYATGLDALLAGWRLLQMSQLLPPARGAEYDVSYLPHEFLFERMVDISA